MRCTQYRDLVVTLDPRSGVRRIRIAVPRRKNAIRLDTYRHLAEALREADADPHTKITLLTGGWIRPFLINPGQDLLTKSFTCSNDVSSSSTKTGSRSTLSTNDVRKMTGFSGSTSTD